ncbi:unnamed protein product [Mytilus edulis]|uniref:Uncharacterized protein n=1 Tax=Mytilus edulis TaxID=6550 RepID=A0A8S3TI06_MYTED|nr:unnamed protein product [Mytilus edulis]
MPSYSSPRPNQRHMELELPGQTSENMGLSPGHVQMQETDTGEMNLLISTKLLRNTRILGVSVEEKFFNLMSIQFGGPFPEQGMMFGMSLFNTTVSVEAIEDLYCRAYPDSPEIEDENFIKTLLDKCGQSEDFRLAVKRTRPNTLHDAVINAMQEECFRVGEKGITKQFKPVQRPIFEVEDWDSDEDVTTEAEGTRRENVDRNNVPDNYPRNNGIESRVRFYNRDRWRGRGRSPMFKNRPPEFPEPRRGP